jgi:tRNA threonylcarbamoyladenosine biosynthesis protein TsaB
LLLAIDTSAGTSAAVFSDRLLGYSSFEDRFGHAENVGLAIAQALDRAGVRAAEITGVAIGRGPAPYTGLRVGMAAGLSFAGGLGVPAYGVMVLDAVAHSLGSGDWLLYSDAKRREFFAAGYRSGERVFGPEVISPDKLESMTQFSHQLAECNAELVGAFAISALEGGADLSDLSALYLRSPDVSPSPGKRVSG